jgi:hypothetical protein
MRKNQILVSIVMLIVGGFLGWGIATAREIDNSPTNLSGFPIVGVGGGPNDLTTPQNTDLLLGINNLFKEHGVMAVNHLQAVYDGKDTLPTGQLLDENGNKIADVFASLYGSEIRSKFVNMWKGHINEYVNYTQGLKDKDLQRMDQAKKNLSDLALHMGAELNKVDPNISSDGVTNLTNEHVALTLGIIDSYSKGDQTQMISQLKSASDQATKYAEFLTQAIMTSRPEAFR